MLYQANARYDWWLKVVVIVVIAVTLVPAFILLNVELSAALIMFGATLFDALLFHAVLPRRYQIYTNRLRVVLGYPFAINLPLATIQVVRMVSGSRAFVYGGIRFATSSRGVVEIIRRKGMNMVISPEKVDLFLEQLDQVLGQIAEYESHLSG